ncbi:LppU/SCO3897 family protein [Micromonospora sp. URMC 103]|uniref:LppU/SCO3897 family protein n=1 Tax=Micromonospora sp. URMC 103 TaxID=3423406 RepID=UPI003F1A52BE
MTSEGPHHPGQEPDEVSPGAGGPAPYGDRPAQPGNGYGATGPDLGWAPPPPAGSPNPSAPAWAAQQDQPPAWGAAQTPPATEPGQPAPWGATGAPQAAWGGAAEQPAWAQAQPGARGAAQVPAPAAPPQGWPQDDSARSGGWPQPEPGAAASQDDQAGAGWPQSGQANGGWAAGGHPGEQPANGGWGNGAPDNASAAWAGGQQQTDQPAWAQADQGAPGWAQAEQSARGAAQVPAADDPGRGGWAPQQDAAGAGGWPGGAANQQDAPGAGGWPGSATNQQDAPGAGGWPGGAANQPAGAGQPAGWGAAPTPDDRPRQQPDWLLNQDQDRSPDDTGSAGWGGSAGDPNRSGGWAAEPGTAPTRASAGAPGTGSLPQRNPADRSSVPDVEPWAAGEAWGAAADPARPAEEPPVYQPGPAPGISPANAVPLPPQEQRVPGASLAAAPPADYGSPAEVQPATYGTPSERGDWPQADQPGPAYESEPAVWGQQADARGDEPSSPAGPVVPAPRTSPESGAALPDSAAGRATASAAVPLASRVVPPNDQAMPAAAPAPQPRVYGRPARPEPADEPEQAEPDGYGVERRPEPGPDPRFDDRMQAPSGYAEAAPPAPPAFPPGLPSFADAPSSNRPVNGVRPHPGAERPGDPFGPPPGDPGVPGVPPGYGPPPVPEPTSAFPPAFPPPPQQQPGPSWPQAEPAGEQNRFDAFKPDEEPKTEAPAPKVRNGRVLAAVLTAAVLILAVPLGLLFLLGKVGGSQEPDFNPAVGTCVKKSGEGAAPADCGEADAFTVVSKVDSKDKCGDPAQPQVVLPGDGPNRVLCLKPAAAGQ